MQSKPPIDRRLALEELARRKGLLRDTPTFELSDYLFDKQLAFVLDPAPFKVAVTTRRAGKTVSCAADLIHTATHNDGVICLYITLSRKNAKRLVWPEFKKLNAKYGLKGIQNETDLSIAFPNGSMLYLLGASDRTSIEDFRGLALKKVYLDESQSFPSYIEQLIDDVLGPALMDHNGQLILIGTPGPVPVGYFYDLSSKDGWSHHFWSYFDNPKLPFLLQGLTHQDMLDRELKRRGVTIDNPSIQREWFGLWKNDTDSLVYQYNASVNHFDTLPDSHNWTYILGVDLGYDDADALAVVAYNENSPVTYVLEQFTARHQDLTELCKQIDKLTARYEITKIIVDTGGLGKKITEEISKRYTIPMVPAEKVRKVEFIELMNDALRSGRLRIKANSQFAHDAQKVEWDHDKSTPDKKVISSKFHSDICEAVLYAWRESYSYTYKAPMEDLEYGTAAWGNEEARKMLDHKIEEMQEQQEALGLNEEGEEYDLEGLQTLDRPKLRYQGKFNQYGKNRPK